MRSDLIEARTAETVVIVDEDEFGRRRAAPAPEDEVASQNNTTSLNEPLPLNEPLFLLSSSPPLLLSLFSSLLV
jgi:hypothetical protein